MESAGIMPVCPARRPALSRHRPPPTAVDACAAQRARTAARARAEADLAVATGGAGEADSGKGEEAAEARRDREGGREGKSDGERGREGGREGLTMYRNTHNVQEQAAESAPPRSCQEPKLRLLPPPLRC
jgi:hypothetical protein